MVLNSARTDECSSINFANARQLNGNISFRSANATSIQKSNFRFAPCGFFGGSLFGKREAKKNKARYLCSKIGVIDTISTLNQESWVLLKFFCSNRLLVCLRTKIHGENYLT